MDNIDFVLTWVDGSDIAWQEEKAKYAAPEAPHNAQYRNWDILKYWFRSVEKNAPWVNRIHFVTCGQIPGWLNTQNPKLHLVSHKDYIPDPYLPTFSSHVIELFFHRIPGLSDHFVYFNDDTFINAAVKPEDFFRGGLPCDCAVESVLSPAAPGDPFAHYLLNDVAVINHCFSKRKCIREHMGKWMSPRYKGRLLNNMACIPHANFSAFMNFHIPQAFDKHTYEEVWEACPTELLHTAAHKFRDRSDVNQYLFRYWQLAKGHFCPGSTTFGRFYTIGKNDDILWDDITSGRHKVICINDSIDEIDFEAEKQQLIRCFEQKYPNPSRFELP